MLALALAAGAATFSSATAAPAAASTCTDWDSKTDPPDTIRVLRTKQGVVDRVDFRRYVGIVMAAEWPAFYPPATLEAAAVAVKQYAWYYTMHHRSSYVTSGGSCYDVKDNTTDQIYWPDTRSPKPEHLDAIQATWGLTLRKNDRFFLTGYRSGPFVECGEDADGWRLYAHSAFQCGKDGLSRAQIQHIYYDPKLTFVWSNGRQQDTGGGGGGGGSGDTSAPSVTAPELGIRQPGTFGEQSTVISWSGQDEGTGIASYQLQRSLDGGSFSSISLSSPRQTSVNLGLSFGRAYRFRVRATDEAGNQSAWKEGPSITPRLYQETSATVDYDGSWTSASSSSASGDATRYATASGAQASLTFTGRGVAVVAPTGVGRGKAEIRVDGVLVATVDLEASSLKPRRIVYGRTWDAVGEHTVSVRVLGTDGRPRVDLDAILVYR